MSLIKKGLAGKTKPFSANRRKFGMFIRFVLCLSVFIGLGNFLSASDLYLDFIYWQVNLEGLEFARDGGAMESLSAPVSGRGRILVPDCRFEPGFRVGADWDKSSNDGTFFAEFTHLEQCSSTQKNVVYGAFGLFPLIDNKLGLYDANGVKGAVDFCFNVLDFGMGKTWCLKKGIDFYPYFGFKAAWQDLKFDVVYDFLESTSSALRNRLQNKTTLKGIGLRGGFNAGWKFNSCFTFVGRMAASALYSQFCTYRKDINTTVVRNSEGEGNKNLDLHESSTVLIPVFELMLGVRWDSSCSPNWYVVLGWENQIWWGMNRFLFISTSADSLNNNTSFGSHGNLTFQGLVLRGGMDF